jgi:hypothetical protein
MPGRPRGSTKANIIKENKEKEHCKAEISKIYNQKMNEAEADGLTLVLRGYLKILICEKKKELGISAQFYISDETIRT